MREPSQQNWLREEPLDEARLREVDAERLSPVVDGLYDVLGGYLRKRRRVERAKHVLEGDASQGMVIGLYGGLGQGKTSILGTVAEKLGRAHLVPSWSDRSRMRRPRIVKLDISAVRADAIEYWFWIALLWRSRNFWIGAVAIVALALLAPTLAGLLQLPTPGQAAKPSGQAGFNLAGFLPWWPQLLIILPLLPIVADTLVGLSRRWFDLDLHWLDLLVYRSTRFLPIWPDILIIDDLDRARVDQQRSLLWSLHRRASRIDFAILVALDETELLTSEPNPESPEELLRKVILLTFRIPPRGPEAASWISISTVVQWVKANRSSPLVGTVDNTVIAAKLARLAVVLQQIGPRRMKSLLQDALAQAAAYRRGALANAVIGQDFGAVLWLTALRQEWPQCLQHVSSLQEYLRRPGSLAMARLIAPLEKAPAVRLERVRRLLLDAAAFAPAQLGWTALLTEQSAADLSKSEKGKPSHQVSSCGFKRLSPLRVIAVWSLHASMAKQGYAPSADWREQLLATETGPGVMSSDSALLAAILCLGCVSLNAHLAEADDLARLSWYEFWLDEVLADPWPSDSSSRPLDSDVAEPLVKFILSLLCSDGRVLSLLSPEALKIRLTSASKVGVPWSALTAGLAAAEARVAAIAWGVGVHGGWQEPPHGVSAQVDMRAAFETMDPSNVTEAKLTRTLGYHLVGKEAWSQAWPPLPLARWLSTDARPSHESRVLQVNRYIADAASAYPNRQWLSEVPAVRHAIHSPLLDAELTPLEWIQALAPLLRREGDLESWDPDMGMFDALPLPAALKRDRFWSELFAESNLNGPHANAAVCAALLLHPTDLPLSRNAILGLSTHAIWRTKSLAPSIVLSSGAQDWLQPDTNLLESEDEWAQRLDAWLSLVDIPTAAGRSRTDASQWATWSRWLEKICATAVSPSAFAVVQQQLSVLLDTFYDTHTFAHCFSLAQAWEWPRASKQGSHRERCARRWLACAIRHEKSAAIEKRNELIHFAAAVLRSIEDVPADWRAPFDIEDTGTLAPFTRELLDRARALITDTPSGWAALAPPSAGEGAAWLRRFAVYLWDDLQGEIEDIEVKLRSRIDYFARPLAPFVEEHAAFLDEAWKLAQVEIVQ